jgi:FtsP/CotA-like multicopper oxidase with cupredoxin domain
MCQNQRRDLAMSENGISRRRLLGGAAAVAAPAAIGLSGLLGGRGTGADSALAADSAGGGHAGHGEFPHAAFAAGGTVDHRANGFDPTAILRDFDYGKTRRLASGRVLREWEIVAHDKEIEVAPGVKYEAWTYNGRVPGPTLRASEGELLRIRFVNASDHPHTMHFHGVHRAGMDGMPGIGEMNGGGQVDPGESFTYEFDASPFGLHLYHCHVAPLAAHIARGLYGAFVIDPKRGRPEADEMVMVMNGFDTNFDLANEVYAVNTVGFHFVNEPIQVRRGELVRVYLVNVLEYDPLNSFHIHGNFFQLYPTGTALEPREYTDTVIQGQGQRAILELEFPFDGDYMFHAHVSEFAELGWTGFFRVGDPSRLGSAAAAAAYCELPWGKGEKA